MAFPRNLRCLLPLLAILGTHAVKAADARLPPRRVVLQPVHEYLNLTEALQPEYGDHILNGFLNYTHLGSDFGFLGPGELHCTCMPGSICADLPPKSEGWAGVWHSLNGLARENQTLNLKACYPSIIQPAFQPRVVGIKAVVMGAGQFKLELKTDQKDPKGPKLPGWSESLVLTGAADIHTITRPIDPAVVPEAQFLNWVAEGGSDMCVDSLALQVELPPVDFPTYVFLASYAKLARCYSEQTGMVRDRAHITPDALNAVPATGMFALATTAAWRVGIVEESRARSTVRRIMETVRTLPRQRGLLPHFVHLQDGKWQPLRGSEYSSIDTALCLFSLRIAGQMLKDEQVATQALEMLKGLRMDTLRDPAGYVIHGMRDDGTPLSAVWRDWGGETALVLMMQRVAAGPTFIPKMDDSGRSHRGIGFITEIPSLFHPRFNTNARAHAGLVDWRAYRQERLAEQKAYFPKTAPESLAARLGLYGLSAGEGARGRGYHVGGVEDAGENLIFPHYVLMSALMEKDPSSTYDLLAKMESRGWMPPWGLVENIEADGSSYVPMIGSLNASFEALAAYHLLMNHRRTEDDVYLAASADPVFQDAIQAVFE